VTKLTSSARAPSPPVAFPATPSESIV
jgi:hypothetical protein